MRKRKHRMMILAKARRARREKIKAMIRAETAQLRKSGERIERGMRLLFDGKEVGRVTELSFVLKSQA